MIIKMSLMPKDSMVLSLGIRFSAIMIICGWALTLQMIISDNIIQVEIFWIWVIFFMIRWVLKAGEFMEVPSMEEQFLGILLAQDRSKILHHLPRCLQPITIAVLFQKKNGKTNF